MGFCNRVTFFCLHKDGPVLPSGLLADWASNRNLTLYFIKKNFLIFTPRIYWEIHADYHLLLFFCNLLLQEILCSVGFCHFILLLNAWGAHGFGALKAICPLFMELFFLLVFVSNIRIYIYCQCLQKSYRSDSCLIHSLLTFWKVDRLPTCSFTHCKQSLESRMITKICIFHSGWQVCAISV